MTKNIELRETVIANIKATGITDDSRVVKPGFVFVASPGLNSDGHNYIKAAIAAGAATIVGEKDIKINGVRYIKVKDSRKTLGELASKWYGEPSKKIKIVGVTGTKGKTTTTHLIYHILNSAGKKVGMVSSITAKIGESEVDTGFHVTSPDVVSLHKFLKQMSDAGCEYAVIEVSSHGIDQKRIAGVDFEVGVLTNIKPEHLDYHKTFKEYKKTKMSFINSIKHKVISPESSGLNILEGEFNNINAEAAIKAVEYLGISRAKAFKSISTFVLPAGRLENIQNKLGIRVVIDFAHTPDSLEKALTHLRQTTKGKLISVFGCAGERDTRKRSQMGRISGNLADISVFTAEDPRTENVYKILSQMKRYAKKYIAIPERGEAIPFALSLAKKGDTVAFFGKGHEKSMAYQGFEHPWSEHDEINNFFNRDMDVSAVILAAGKGSRMKSATPKIVHNLCGRPMISYSLQNLRRSRVGEIIVVVSFKKNIVAKSVCGSAKIAVQKNPKGGTANATLTAIPFLSARSKYVMVLYGDDTAFYTPQTLRRVLEKHVKSGSVLTFITLMKDNPQGLGRIIRDKRGNLVGIVEEKDATPAQRKIKEVNDGLYVFNKDWLKDNLRNISKSSVTGEYYIVDLIKMGISQGKKVTPLMLPDSDEWQGVNTPEELIVATKKMEKKLRVYNG